MNTVRVGLFGTGTVGCGVIEILQKHHDDFKRHCGVDIELVALTSREPEVAARYGLSDIFCSVDDILENNDIDLVIELIGGAGFAHEVVKRALESGKNVVTANKALMATYGEELMTLADTNGLYLLFEGSVGGGIPIISPLKHCLVSNEISSVLGIVNGTTNYVLSRMAADHLSYDDALLEAQQKGFAEADPSADVDGYDAAAKIAILSSIAFNSRVTINDVFFEGIRFIAPIDLEYAYNMGYAIKLLAIANRTDEGLDIRVHPTMLPLTHQLANVNGVDNAIYVVGDSVGPTMFFGRGAGAGPAASAVMGDVIEASRFLTKGVTPIVGCTCTDAYAIRPISDLRTQYYVRLDVADQAGVLAATSTIFGEHGVSIDSMMQHSAMAGKAQIIFVMHRTREADFMAALEDIRKLDVVNEVAAIIRVENR